jgi:hypothetical protein
MESLKLKKSTLNSPPDDTNDAGWVALHRKIMEGEYWLSEPFTRAQAWIDLILLANHKQGYIRKRGIPIEVQRGQVGYSEETLALRWRWSREKIRRFLKELKSSGSIMRIPAHQNSKLSNLISITNYDLYQATVHQAIQQTDIKRYRNNNDNNKKNTYIPVFNFWNRQEIIVHRRLSDKDCSAINIALRDFSQEEIFHAITNYATVLKSSEHYFKHRWTLRDFLQRGLRKFVNEADPLGNFKKESFNQADKRTEAALKELAG